MCVYAPVCVRACMPECLCICTYVCPSMHVSVCVCVCAGVCFHKSARLLATFLHKEDINSFTLVSFIYLFFFDCGLLFSSPLG